MISEGEKKYLEHAIELAEYIDQQNMTGNLKQEILDKMLIPYGLSDERKNGQQKLMQDQPNGNPNPAKNDMKSPSTEQPKNQPAKIDPLDEILRKYGGNLHKINEGKIEISPRFKDPGLYHTVSDKMFELGWKREKGEDAFVRREGVKA